MGTEIIILLITNVLAPIITGIITWLQTKKKYNAEIDSSVIRDMKESLAFYKQLNDDQTERLEELLEANKDLRHQVETLQDQVLKLALRVNQYELGHLKPPSRYDK